MRMTPIYNLSLLRVIANLNEATIEDIKKAYLPAEQPGVVWGAAANFNDELDTLARLGYISIEGDNVKFIGYR